jgi:flagellar assembly protein FliH
MKPIHGRIIKSEEVRFIRKAGKLTAGERSVIDGKRALDSADDAVAASDLEILKQIHLRKIRLAEQQAFKNGLSEGIREGRNLEKLEALRSVQAMGALIDELSGLKKTILEAAEDQVLKLVLAVTKKVIHMEVQTNREIIRNVLTAAMRNIVDRENMKVRVNPQDFQYLMEIKPDFLQNFDGIKNIVFDEDASIPRGGVVIDTMFGEVDARLDHQYDEIESSLTASLRNF